MIIYTLYTREEPLLSSSGALRPSWLSSRAQTKEWREWTFLFLIETTTLRNKLKNHKARDQFHMHMGNQQSVLSCTSNLCLQGIIKVDRQSDRWAILETAHTHTHPHREMASLVHDGHHIEKKNPKKHLGCTRNFYRSLLIIGAMDSCNNRRICFSNTELWQNLI